MSKDLSRRAFSKTSVSAATAAAAVVSLAPGRVLGANDQVRLGFIGVGNRGCQLLKGFLPHADARIVAVCDVYEPYLNEPTTGSTRGSPVWVAGLPECRSSGATLLASSDFPRFSIARTSMRS